MLADHSRRPRSRTATARVLRDNRARDAAAGRTLDGPHLTDLAVRLRRRRASPPRDASTGEQKALLIGLVLAHAGLVAEMTGIAPVLLLDEVVAHLDPARRAALFDALIALGAQVWMTGADPALFGDIAGRAQMFRGAAAGTVGARKADQVFAAKFQPLLSAEFRVVENAEFLTPQTLKNASLNQHIKPC